MVMYSLIKQKYYKQSLSIILAVFFSLVLSLLPLLGAKAVTVDELNSQAREIENKIKINEDHLGALAERAGSLEEKLNQLRGQIAEINTQIENTTNKISVLQEELTKTEKELDRQKSILKNNIRTLYKQGNISTVQLLASTDNYADFVNEQEYLEKLKLGVQESADKVAKLKEEIETKKTEQEELREQQKAQRELAERNKNEQDSLLAQTRGEEAEYKRVTEDLQNQQASILAQIVARSRVLTGVGTGNYPWSSYREGSWTHAGSCNYGDDVDPWQYCYRQCTSFTAWRVYASGRQAPVGYGNANNWGYIAAANGIATGGTPKVGAVAVWGGAEGHVAYVEEVYGDGQARISEYNAVPALQGRYSERVISPDDPYIYIYF